MMDKSIPYFGVLMVKTDTADYPRYELPDGFTMTGYQPGFETEWAKLMVEVDHTDTLQEAEKIFQNEFLSNPSLLPKQCLFILDSSGKTAATASLWHGEHFGKTCQRIHWVAAKPEFQGKGLIKALLTKLLDIYNKMGFRDFLYLTSQTWSYKAINLYFQFGFKPYTGEKPLNWKADHFDENTRLAWENIQKKIEEYRQSKSISFSIQKAVPSDADDIADILCKSWKEAYPDILTKEELECHTNEQARENKIKRLNESGVDGFFLAFSHGLPCGLVFYGASRDSDMPDAAEIVAFYTLESYWGKGVGKKLMDFSLSEIKRRGYQKVILWVFEENRRARRFYEKSGFQVDGSIKDSGFGQAKEVRYCLR